MKKIIVLVLMFVIVFGADAGITKLNLENEAFYTKCVNDAVIVQAVMTATGANVAKAQAAIQAATPLIMAKAQDIIDFNGVTKVIIKDEEGNPTGEVLYFHVVRFPYLETTKTQITEVQLAELKAQQEEAKAQAIIDANKIIADTQAIIDAIPTASEEE